MATLAVHFVSLLLLIASPFIAQDRPALAFKQALTSRFTVEMAFVLKKVQVLPALAVTRRRHIGFFSPLEPP